MTMQPTFCHILSQKSSCAFGLDKNWHSLGFSSKDCQVRKIIFRFPPENQLCQWFCGTRKLKKESLKFSMQSYTEYKSLRGKMDGKRVFAVRIFQLKKLKLETFKCMGLALVLEGGSGGKLSPFSTMLVNLSVQLTWLYYITSQFQSPVTALGDKLLQEGRAA